MKRTTFWDITPCSPLKFHRSLGRTYRLHLQGQRIIPSKKPAWKQVASRAWLGNCHILSLSFLARIILRPWRWRRCSFETSVVFQRTTRCYIPEDNTLQVYFQIIISQPKFTRVLEQWTVWRADKFKCQNMSRFTVMAMKYRQGWVLKNCGDKGCSTGELRIQRIPAVVMQTVFRIQ
jgi:hypothetical protein